MYIKNLNRLSVKDIANFIRRQQDKVASRASRYDTRDIPSFRFKVESLRRVDHEAASICSIHRNDLSSYDNKLGGRMFASNLGIRVPNMLCEPCPISDIDFRAMPDSFVLKPVWGSGGKGVNVLTRQDRDQYKCARSGKVMSVDEIVGRALDLVKKKSVSEVFYCEQSLLGPCGRLPYDWKVYAFQGSVKMILQIRRDVDGKTHKYYDSQWNCLGNIRLNNVCDCALPLPEFGDEIIATAEILSRGIDRPFIRVDLFELKGIGVVFGEMSPRPGSQYFVRSIDRDLGLAWEEAEARMKALQYRKSAEHSNVY